MIMKKILVTAAVAVIVVLKVAAAHAATLYVSENGNDVGDCSQASAPCASIEYAANLAFFDGEEIVCVGDGYFTGGPITKNVTIDCNGRAVNINPLTIENGATVVLRNLGVVASSGFYGVAVDSGNLTMENVHIRAGTPALQIQPNTPSKIAVKNCIFDDNAGGVLIKPASGGSVLAVFDHVTITGNSGGGIKTDSTNGVVDLDVTDSAINNNSGNGINAVAGANQNIVSIKNSVIARNGAAGVQANGVTAGVLLQTTLLDQNAAGATSVVNGGNMFTYGNNSIVGNAGSGFNHSQGLQ